MSRPSGPRLRSAEFFKGTSNPPTPQLQYWFVFISGFKVVQQLKGGGEEKNGARRGRPSESTGESFLCVVYLPFFFASLMFMTIVQGKKREREQAKKRAAGREHKRKKWGRCYLQFWPCTQKSFSKVILIWEAFVFSLSLFNLIFFYTKEMHASKEELNPLRETERGHLTRGVSLILSIWGFPPTFHPFLPCNLIDRKLTLFSILADY